jgi:serine O-acetyltransferase
MSNVGNVRPLRAETDPVFAQIRREAEEALRREPELGCFLASSILNHATLEQAVAHRLAARLSHSDFPGDIIRQNFLDFCGRDASFGIAVRADLLAVVDRDPACERVIEPLLYFKGFYAC